MPRYRSAWHEGMAMALQLTRRGLAGGAAALGLLAAFAAAAPSIAALRFDDGMLLAELERMIGADVTVGAFRVDVFPRLTVIMQQVEVNAGGGKLLEAAAATVTLSPTALLRGRLAVGSLTLEQPVFNMAALPGSPWLQRRDSQIAKRLATHTDPEAGGFRVAELDGFDSLVVRGGTILRSTGSDGVQSGGVTGLDAVFSWPDGGQKASLAASGVWNGETAAIEASSATFASLLAGQPGAMTLQLNSQPADIRFDGRAALAGTPFLQGRLTAQTRSVARAAKWLDVLPSLTATELPMTIDGALNADAARWQLQEAEISIGSNTGSGALTYLPAAESGGVSATLAFQALDITALASVVEAFAPGYRAAPDREFNSVDLRVSADSARLGDVVFSGVAAAMKIAPDLSVLDINNAEAFGGTFQVSLRRAGGASGGESGQVEMRVLAENVETSDFAAFGGPWQNLPRGKAVLSAILSGTEAGDLAGFLGNARGTVKLRMAQGVLSGFDLAALESFLEEGRSSVIEPLPYLATRFEDLNLEARLSAGMMTLEALRVALPEGRAVMSGTYRLIDSSVAVSGELRRNGQSAGKDAPALPFLLGGRISAPVLSSLGQAGTAATAAP
jgi:AsmA protein